MATIYEKTAGALIASGERTVATYDSGLVRVDQRYICTTASAATHRATLIIGASMPDGNSTPCIDGLYIFPSPQEIQRQDGFTEFAVSAYGRISTALNAQTLQQETVRNNAYIGHSQWRVSGQIVITAGSVITLDDLGISDSLYEPFNFFFTNTAAQFYALDQETVAPAGSSYRVYYSTDGGVSAAGSYRFYSYKPKLLITSYRAFGKFCELEITTQREGTTAEVV